MMKRAKEHIGKVCDCFDGKEYHLFNEDSNCEYFDHHCEMCHKMELCTSQECE